MVLNGGCLRFLLARARHRVDILPWAWYGSCMARIIRKGIDDVPKDQRPKFTKAPEPTIAPDPEAVRELEAREEARKGKLEQARAAKTTAVKSPTGASVVGVTPNQARTGSVTTSVSRAVLLDVERRLRLCQDHTLIEENLSQQHGVHRRTVRTWIAMVYAEWERVSKEYRPHARERVRAALEDFYAQAMQGTEKGPDFKAAIQALDRLARLDGCYEPVQVQIDSGTPFKTVDSFRARMLQLVRRPEIQERLGDLGVKIIPEEPANVGPDSGNGRGDPGTGHAGLAGEPAPEAGGDGLPAHGPDDPAQANQTGGQGDFDLGDDRYPPGL